MTLDPGSSTEHNGRGDRFRPAGRNRRLGKAPAIGAFQLYDVSRTKNDEHPIAPLGSGGTDVQLAAPRRVDPRYAVPHNLGRTTRNIDELLGTGAGSKLFV